MCAAQVSAFIFHDKNEDLAGMTHFPVLGRAYSRTDYILVDLTRRNPALAELPVDDQERLGAYLAGWRARWCGRVLWGGYGEERYFYASSAHFAGRNVHLGVDLWAPAGTAVYAPADGVLHSQAYNDKHRDYGGTILLECGGAGDRWTVLFGHLSRASLSLREAGARVRAGEKIGELGDFHENGGWIPHLHLQKILGSPERTGDFPGVCSADEWGYYRERCPAPYELIFG